MKFRLNPVRSSLVLALSLVISPAIAGDYSKTIFFGDSLTDSGYFQPLLPPEVQAVTGKFTTNPGFVWAEFLARYYGTNGRSSSVGGDNYAIGGARVAEDASSQFGPVASLQNQMKKHLAANGGSLDSNALYGVWGGANDIFAITAGAPAEATLGAAAAGMVSLVKNMEAAGARYILVSNLPDMGLTPDAIAAGPMAQGMLTQLADTYNQSVFTGLTQANVRFIPMNTFNLLQEITAKDTFAKYGFVNVTTPACKDASSLVCNPTSVVSPDAAQTYAFADGVHPSSAAHNILGQYSISILDAPRLQAVVSHSARVAGQARSNQVANHLTAGSQEAGLHWWGGIRSDIQRFENADLYDGVMPSGTFGVDFVKDQWVVGGFAGYGRQRADFGNRRGNFRQTDTTLGLFAGWYDAHLWANAQISYTWLDYQIRRDVQLGPVTRRHSGSPNGSNLSAALNAGYEWGEANFRHGPVVGLVSQTIKVNAYNESHAANEASTALNYSRQKVNALIGSAGWQMSYGTSEYFRPYAQLTYDYNFEKNPNELSAQVQSLPNTMAYHVPAIDFDRGYSTLLLGARTKLFGVNANLGASTTMAQHNARDISVFATFNGNF